MTAFASTDDLAAYLGIDVDVDRAQLLLEFATAAIQNQARQHLAYVADDTIVLAGRTQQIHLPERPVIGIPVVAGLVPSAVYRYDPPDVLTYGIPSGNLAAFNYAANGPDISYGIWPLQVTVTYTHGFATIPDDLRGVCVSAAARSYANPQGYRSETAGPFSVQYAGAGDILVPGLSLSSGEQQVVNRYRRRVTSVQLV